MTLAGWWIMGLSVGAVVSLFLWCIWMVFRTSRHDESLHGFEQVPPDVEADRPPR
jgi:hypothetical protein